MAQLVSQVHGNCLLCLTHLNFIKLGQSLKCLEFTDVYF